MRWQFSSLSPANDVVFKVDPIGGEGEFSDTLRVLALHLCAALIVTLGTAISQAWADETLSTPVAAASPKAIVPVIPWALRPYDVQVRISFSNALSMPVALRDEWIRQLREQLTAHFGEMWKLHVQLDPGISIEELAKLTTTSAQEKWSPTHADKVFRLLVMEQGSALLIAGREWDMSSQSLGNVQQQSVLDRRNLVGDLALLVAGLFRPLVEIGAIEGQNIECVARGGEFPTPNSADAPFATGSYLVPFVRYLDKSKQVKRIQSVPWTYLEVETINRSRMELKLRSAFPAPLPASRRRLEVLALLVQPQWPSTDVLIYPRGNRQNTLVGVRCFITPQIPPAGDKEHVPLELITDRRGIVTVPAHAGEKLQSLQVYSGTALLARVPLLPGAVPSLELETPDDRTRLGVEGEVQLLEGELVDIMATREVLIARTKAAAEKKNWGDVDRFLKDLQRLPTQDQFFARIDKLELQSVQTVRAAKDKIAEARIKRLCESIRESAKKYLEPTRIREFVLDFSSQRAAEESK